MCQENWEALGSGSLSFAGQVERGLMTLIQLGRELIWG